MASLSHYTIPWRRLKFMYVYTTAIAGGIGLAELLVPDRVQSTFGMPAQDPVVFGLAASVFLAFGLASRLASAGDARLQRSRWEGRGPCEFS